MRRYFAALLLVGLFTGGCGGGGSHPETIYVSIAPLRSLVEAITESDFPVEVLVPAGAGPETFEPTPRQFAALGDARFVFSVGLIGFERHMLRKLPDTTRVVDLSRGVPLLAGSCSHPEHHGHTHGTDPHIWTSPRALRVMADNLYEAVERVYPDSVRYRENYRRLCEELQLLDRETEAQIRESGIRSILIYHPALTYYARDYGIEQVAVEQDGKEPSARYLAGLIDRARRERIGSILYQAQYPVSVVETIARDAGVEAVEIDPLKENVLENIREITRIITRTDE